jgi:pimeloyl-ACP methyl ester carboxylesterase
MSFSLALSAALVQFAALNGPVPSLGDAPALRFADVHLPTGVRLRYAEQGDPHGHPVILLHGYSDSWFSYSRVLPLMDPKDHVYALDLRGHGDSDRPASGYDMRSLAADVLAFMNAQRLARVTVVGHSMGSIVAQQLALAAPERIARLVLVGSVAAPAQSAVLIELDGAVRSLGDSVPVEFVREFQESTVYQPLPAGFLDRAVAESLKLPARVWRGLIAGMLATESPVSLGTSRIPTLIVWGDRDAVFPRTEQDALVKMIGTAELTLYRETGHAPHWERPEEFVRDLHAFMERTTSY